jgi:hypothetical protein
MVGSEEVIERGREALMWDGVSRPRAICRRRRCAAWQSGASLLGRLYRDLMGRRDLEVGKMPAPKYCKTVLMERMSIFFSR